MNVLVKLSEIIDELGVQLDDWYTYLNKTTGEIVSLSGEDLRMAEDGEEALESLPDWQKKRISKELSN